MSAEGGATSASEAPSKEQLKAEAERRRWEERRLELEPRMTYPIGSFVRRVGDLARGVDAIYKVLNYAQLQRFSPAEGGWDGQTCYRLCSDGVRKGVVDYACLEHWLLFPVEARLEQGRARARKLGPAELSAALRDCQEREAKEMQAEEDRAVLSILF